MLLVIVIIVSIVALAIYHYRDIDQRERFRRSLQFEAEGSPRLHISVVVVGAADVDYIRQMLKQESNSYEVVVVCDYAEQPLLLHSLKRHFALIRVNAMTSTHLPSSSIRSLYRSHSRLFERLVVVDSASSESYSSFEVGAMVSRYDYNLQILSRRALRPHAIDDLLLELSQHKEGSVDSISSSLRERFRLLRREVAMLPKGERFNYSRGRPIKINYSILRR